ncbi:MAG: flagellar hook-basal body complex protein FliE [Gemmatimonadetes bacterium]|nr:flagellar hook-basal body complex protein FliE [Gemmatimonadota bacterium]
MSDPIAALAARAASTLATQAGQAGDKPNAIQVPVTKDAGPQFGDLLTKAINDVSAHQDKASETIGAFLRGEPVELHRVMAASEEAQISLQMMIEVRNKFLDAYRTLTTMQA